MNHEDIKILISAYIDGEVTSVEKDMVEDHLAGCAECQKEFAQFQKISSSLKRWPQERLSPDVELKVKTRLGSFKEGTMKTKEMSIQWGSVVVVVAIMACSLWGVQTYSKRALQARVRDANNYLTSQTMTLAKTDQYEPYYLSSNYAADRVSNEVDKVVGHDIVQAEVKQKAPVPASVGYQLSTYNASGAAGSVDSIKDTGMVASAKNYGLRENARQYIAYPASSPSIRRTNNYVDEKAYSSFRAQPAAGLKYELKKEIAPYYPTQEEYYYPPTPVDTESYDPVYENGFLSPVNTPLSTFSIDVDTASYSNIRRFLNQGQLPPSDAVRIEELINYFSYDYPEPMWGQPFSITTEVGPCPWNPSHQVALIGLKGKRLNGGSMPASNLVFLIDVSGSMNQPNKLPLLQDAFRMMAHELNGKDKVSIVVYAGAAGLVLDATPGNYKDRIIAAVDRLQAGGSTAGGDGIRLAYQVARDNFIQNGNNRVILATDGDFNVGISNDDDLVRMIESYRDQGVFLTVLGFGEGNLKDSKMEKLADHGNGNYFYIDNNQEARKVLVNELGSTLFTIAKDVKIQVEFNPATVREYRLVGYENRALAKEDFNNDAKDAGELGAGHTVTALYEIVPEQGMGPEYGVDPLVYQKSPQVIRGNSSDVMTVKLRYKEPKSATSQLIKKTISRRDVHSMIQSDNLRFASAVAEFGLLLRNSPYRGQASFEHVLNQARTSKPDAFGYRVEFVGLVERARALSPYIVPQPIPRPMVYQNYPQESSNEKGQK